MSAQIKPPERRLRTKEADKGVNIHCVKLLYTHKSSIPSLFLGPSSVDIRVVCRIEAGCCRLGCVGNLAHLTLRSSVSLYCVLEGFRICAADSLADGTDTLMPLILLKIPLALSPAKALGASGTQRTRIPHVISPKAAWAIDGNHQTRSSLIMYRAVATTRAAAAATPLRRF